MSLINLNKLAACVQYFGGTNFGRTSGGPFYITSYDYDAPIDEYGRLMGLNDNFVIFFFIFFCRR